MLRMLLAVIAGYVMISVLVIATDAAVGGTLHRVRQSFTFRDFSH